MIPEICAWGVERVPWREACTVGTGCGWAQPCGKPMRCSHSCPPLHPDGLLALLNGVILGAGRCCWVMHGGRAAALGARWHRPTPGALQVEHSSEVCYLWIWLLFLSGMATSLLGMIYGWVWATHTSWLPARSCIRGWGVGHLFDSSWPSECLPECTIGW